MEFSVKTGEVTPLVTCVARGLWGLGAVEWDSHAAVLCLQGRHGVQVASPMARVNQSASLGPHTLPPVEYPGQKKTPGRVSVVKRTTERKRDPLGRSPLDKGRDLLQKERRGPGEVHGLLRDAVVPHQEAVRVNNECAHEAGGRPEQQGRRSAAGGRGPGDGQQADALPRRERERHQGRHQRVGVECALQTCPLLRKHPAGTVCHHGERHPVEVVEPVVERVVAVVPGGLAVHTQVPFS